MLGVTPRPRSDAIEPMTVRTLTARDDGGGRPRRIAVLGVLQIGRGDDQLAAASCRSASRAPPAPADDAERRQAASCRARERCAPRSETPSGRSSATSACSAAARDRRCRPPERVPPAPGLRLGEHQDQRRRAVRLLVPFVRARRATRRQDRALPGHVGDEDLGERPASARASCSASRRRPRSQFLEPFQRDLGNGDAEERARSRAAGRSGSPPGRRYLLSGQRVAERATSTTRKRRAVGSRSGQSRVVRIVGRAAKIDRPSGSVAALASARDQKLHRLAQNLTSPGSAPSRRASSTISTALVDDATSTAPWRHRAPCRPATGEKPSTSVDRAMRSEIVGAIMQPRSRSDRARSACATRRRKASQWHRLLSVGEGAVDRTANPSPPCARSGSARRDRASLHRRRHLVALGVAVTIVDRLEPIEVAEEQRHHWPRLNRSSIRATKVRLLGRPVCRSVRASVLQRLGRLHHRSRPSGLEFPGDRIARMAQATAYRARRSC